MIYGMPIRIEYRTRKLLIDVCRVQMAAGTLSMVSLIVFEKKLQHLAEIGGSVKCHLY